jgi:CDP-glycerol glycerophosphotransferase (TagB/SpsB family)
MKKKLVRFAKKTLSIINSLIPKNKYKIVFKSVPDYSGNCKALSDYIFSYHKEYKIIWIYTNYKQKCSPGYTWVKAKKFLAFYHMLTSKYVVTTHNEMVAIKGWNQVNISLWHGMPLKKICYLAPNEVSYMEDYSAKRIATSEIMKAIISASFHERADNVIITGQPRNDFLFEDKKFNFLDSEKTFSKTILYAPTFRHNSFAEKNSDGRAIEDSNFFRFLSFNLQDLQSFLKRHNILLLIKLHPFEEDALNGIEFGRNVIVIKSNEFNALGYDVNHLLKISDCLLTDYSSIYFDYLILNRPIGFVVPDYSEYKRKRGGFTLEPEEYWMPGEKIETQNELIDFLKATLVDNLDKYKVLRNQVNDSLNTFKDNKNSERVFNLLIK